jgi:hypothetical protein
VRPADDELLSFAGTLEGSVDAEVRITLRLDVAGDELFPELRAARERAIDAGFYRCGACGTNGLVWHFDGPVRVSCDQCGRRGVVIGEHEGRYIVAWVTPGTGGEG